MIKRQKHHLLLVLLVMLIGFNGCSVKKRLYQSGYHVEWHNSNPKHKTHQKNKKIAQYHEEAKQEISSENQKVKKLNRKPAEISQNYEPTYAVNNDDVTNLDIINSSKKTQSLFKETTHAIPDTNKNVVNKDNPDSEKLSKNKKDRHWTATIGIIISTIILILVSVIGISSALPFIIYGILSQTLPPIWLFVAPLAPLILFFPFGILGTTFSLIGMKQIKTESEEYKVAKKGFKRGIISIIISIIIAALLIAIAFLFL